MWRCTVTAGPRERRASPLLAQAPDGAADGAYRLVGQDGTVPAQVFGGRLMALIGAMAAGEQRAYTLEADPGLPPAVRAEASGDAIAVGIGAEPFTTLHLTGGPKPFLHPLLAPGGTSVVRGFPFEEAPGDVKDHPHHRGVWIGHGDVNGMDAWEEHPGRIGRIEAADVATASGPVCATVTLACRWLHADGRPVATEARLYRFWGVDGLVRLVDIESTYRGHRGGWLRFGDTKEGALCGVRVAAGMEGQRGGRIATAEGAVGEAEAWGSAASWCDYSGVPLARAAEGEAARIGVAILDHPQNPLHPTRWHVRDYGLMTANPFALSHYRPAQGLVGDWVLPAGQSGTFRFRLAVHKGDEAMAGIARHYADWAFGMGVRWAEG